MNSKRYFFTFLFSLFIFYRIFAPLFARHSDKVRGVAQLVAHLVWDQVVARSSRVTPTFFITRMLKTTDGHKIFCLILWPSCVR